MPAQRLCIVVLVALCLYNKAIGQPMHRFAIVIDELLPDPLPSVQLPNSEFIELKNISSVPFDLRNCKITDGSTSATITVSYTLQPDSFVIICPRTSEQLFNHLGRTIAVTSFPSLNNDADIISLYASDGTMIHSVAYNNSWYQNAVKSEGGWSLEMIDTKNACAGMNNWKASTDASGGTPGMKNSVDEMNADDQPPVLLRTYTVDSLTIAAVFDEPLDSTTASITANYSINKLIGQPVAAIPQMPGGMEVVLKLASPLHADNGYLLTVHYVTDCSGNDIGQFNTAKTGLPLPADSFDIVINEILFNPPPDGFDYIELYNGSNAAVDLNQLFLANRNATGQLTNITSLSTRPWLFFPGEYKTFTENKRWVQQQFLVNDHSVILECAGMPSMPDDKGVIVLMNAQGAIIDELYYDEKWHFPLIDNREGVSLERINYNNPTGDKFNWTSAASTRGFGTPGAPNSQLRADLQVQGQVTVIPPVFSPDNDGYDDYTTIQVQLAEPGYVANITIYDAHGYRVRNLVQQATLSLTGQFRWNGLNDKQNKLPVGNYIILTELFNLQGKTKKFKQVVTLVGK